MRGSLKGVMSVGLQCTEKENLIYEIKEEKKFKLIHCSRQQT